MEPRLPVTLLLKIAASSSSDVATVAVRFAATSKRLRRAILSTAFLHHLADRAEHHGGFDPALLLGASYATHGTSELVQPSPPRLRFDPISSCVHRHSSPCPRATGSSSSGATTARPSVIGAGDSFELFVMDTCLRSRTFSSESGEWGDLRSVQTQPLESSRDHWTMFEPDPDTSAAVVGRTVHWLCQPTWTPGTPLGGDTFILAEPAGVISMWTLAPAEGWSRQVVVSMEGIGAQVTAPGVADASRRRAVWFQPGFGERSGAVLFSMDKVGLVRLSVGTKKAVVVLGCGEGDKSGVQRAFLHEINLASLLQGMKQF
ncbi:hypothetical protein QOZ80_3BG0259080 [Eleusine coracana subsp. coracana]|nr:hypothetical protein QOZ80_3BG0259080 [Eleusine coracana subsp. coracana]